MFMYWYMALNFLTGHTYTVEPCAYQQIKLRLIKIYKVVIEYLQYKMRE